METQTWKCEKYRYYVECCKCQTQMDEVASVGFRSWIVVIKEHTLECPHCQSQIKIHR